MDRKKIVILVFTIVIIVVLYLLRGPLYFKFNEMIYAKEINYAKKTLVLISQNNQDSLKKISTKDAYFLSSSIYIDTCSELLNSVDLDELNVVRTKPKNEKDYKVLYINFEKATEKNDEYRNIVLKYKYLNDKLLLDMVQCNK